MGKTARDLKKFGYKRGELPEWFMDRLEDVENGKSEKVCGFCSGTGLFNTVEGHRTCQSCNGKGLVPMN